MKKMTFLLTLIAFSFIQFSSVYAQESCLPISGGIDASVINGKPLAVLGNVTGTLSGSTYAEVLRQVKQKDGSVELDVTHDFVTHDHSTLKTEDNVVWKPIVGYEGVFHMKTTYRIVSGTGRFAEANGVFYNHGEVDASKGVVTLAYHGMICGVK